MTTVGTSRKCKNGWCESYLEYTKDFEAPELYHFWVSVSLIAATLEQNVMLDREKLGKLPANLYIILVGESAEDKKTTAIDIGEEFLREAVEDIPIAPESVSAQALGEELRDQSEKTGGGAG